MQTDDELAARRQAVADLGAALRDSALAAAESEVDVDRLARAAELAREVTAVLSEVKRAATVLPSVDDMSTSLRFFSPVTGAGGASAPPITFTTTGPDGVVAVGRLDRRFEGPPGFVHGGVTALMLDEVFGKACAVVGRWGMTAFLHTTYRRAIPLNTDLEFRAHVETTEGRKTTVRGGIYLASAPDVPMVEAEGLFVEPRAETQDKYFGGVTDASGAPRSARMGLTPQ